MSTSLYIHIPFCIKRCIYCDFVSGIYNPAKADIYIEALKKELSNIPHEKPLSTLFIGGGTPTALSVHSLSSMIKHIFTKLSIPGNCEATIEVNPGTVDKKKLEAIRSSGINRTSIGIQSFNDNELSFLGRIHSSEEAEQAVLIAREAGFVNIGIDLIYGIPGQGLESWKTTLEKAVRLKPKHISAYELTVEKETLLYEYLKNHPKPDEDKIIGMYEHTINYLTSEGYIHYEISNFAMPGHQCRHNLNYWDRGEYYGVGLGAHSFMNGKRFHNTDDLDEYMKLVSENKRPVKGSETITKDMALSEALFLGLRKIEGIDLKALSELYGKDILRAYHGVIEDLQKAGLLLIGNNNIRLTRKGVLISNEIFEKFV